MGNVGSSGVNGRRRSNSSRRRHPPPQQQPQPEISANQYVFAAATPYPSQYPNPNPPPYYQYPPYYPPPPPPSRPLPMSAPFDHPHRLDPSHADWISGRYPCRPMIPQPAPYVEHQKAVTIRNDVNLKKETLRLEPDNANPGKSLVAFTFDATVAGRYTIIHTPSSQTQLSFELHITCSEASFFFKVFILLGNSWSEGLACFALMSLLCFKESKFISFFM